MFLSSLLDADMSCGLKSSGFSNRQAEKFSCDIFQFFHFKIRRQHFNILTSYALVHNITNIIWISTYPPILDPFIPPNNLIAATKTKFNTSNYNMLHSLISLCFFYLTQINFLVESISFNTRTDIV